MKIIKLKNVKEVGIKTAELFINQVNEKHNSILGLATGSSPIETYKNIIKANENKEVSFKEVITFNLDEYVGLKENDPQSYRTFMNENLFNHIDIDLKNTHIPSSTNLTNPAEYDNEIKKAGGIDLQLLGLGINGHIGFNEPGTSFDSKTSIVNLAKSTIEANSRFFESESDVPTKAISMGLGSIMNARAIVLIATGENKADAIGHLVNGEITEEWPVTILRNHSNVTIIVDELAGKLI